MQHDCETATVELLLEAGVRAELLLGALERRQGSRPSAEHQETAAAPAEDRVQYEGAEGGERLMDAEGKAVMMQWEEPLMEAHAHVVARSGSDVLNVGFGLGLVDEAIQRRHPRTHTIIEAHPGVHARMLRDGWHKRPGVRIVFGRWQEALAQLGRQFDGVFFDTYSEFYEDMRAFHEALPRLLRPGGVYSYFNGLAADNAFFHRVYCEVVKRELATLGFDTQFVALPSDAAVANEVWEGVRNRYWRLDTYMLPVCQLEDTVEQ
ncbi:hypothetical protein WJX81_003470 [Elliptochloris bilobata]|uniref:RMT2 domain-containing protein n=1 Tax=Elliptochloris bilobata TaxID=381761 RepID=A0AAW1RAJ5_9CHLO